MTFFCSHPVFFKYSTATSGLYSYEYGLINNFEIVLLLFEEIREAVKKHIGATKKGFKREQNWEIRSKMGAKSFKMGPFWGMVIHENTYCKTKFKL